MEEHVESFALAVSSQRNSGSRFLGITHHEGHKAAVAAAPPLLLITRPHDLDAGDGPEAPKLPLEHLLVHVRRQVADVPA